MPDTEEPPEIGPEQLDAVLRYLPIFSQPGYVFGEWHMPEGQFPFYAYNDQVIAFIQELYRIRTWSMCLTGGSGRKKRSAT